jgi:hypothetical protein
VDLRDIPPRTANFQFAPRSLRSLACRFFFCFNSLFFDSVRGGVSYLRRARYVACKPKACVLPQMGFPGSSSGVEDRIQEGICWV